MGMNLSTWAGWLTALLRRKPSPSPSGGSSSSSAKPPVSVQPAQRYRFSFQAKLNAATSSYDDVLLVIERRFGCGMVLTFDLNEETFTAEYDMATPEGKVKKRVKDMLEAFAPDVYYTMPTTAGFGNSGTADFLACCWGQFLAIECKAGDNKPTALQMKSADDVRAAGGTSLVINEHNLENLAVQLAVWKGLYGSRTADIASDHIS